MSSASNIYNSQITQKSDKMSNSWLTAIPPEIRTKIYVHLSRTTPVIIHVFLQDKRPWPPCWDNEKKTCISLLLVCKTINDKATQLFLDETPFSFAQHGCVCISHVAKDETAQLPQIGHLNLVNTPKQDLEMSRFTRGMRKTLQDGRKLRDLILNGPFAGLQDSTWFHHKQPCIDFTENLRLVVRSNAGGNSC